CHPDFYPFYSYCSAAPLDLHSFPTRRSSDLSAIPRCQPEPTLSDTCLQSQMSDPNVGYNLSIYCLSIVCWPFSIADVNFRCLFQAVRLSLHANNRSPLSKCRPLFLLGSGTRTARAWYSLPFRP